ncbi:MAG TPA: type II secretion system F family protein [Actinomycetales bacterium]|jgi:tight adherence protein C|nr:type II secretion system F family protein [Actinomycetales bacterium]
MNESIVLALGVGLIFIALVVALVEIGSLTHEDEGVSRSIAAIEAFGAPSPGIRIEAEPSFNARVLTPLMARMVVLGRRLTPADNANRLRAKLDRAGNPPGWTVDRVVAMKVVGFGIGLVGSLIFTAVLGLGLMPRVVVTVAVSMIGYVGVNFWLYQRAYDRAEKMQKGLPDALDLLTISVEAGLGFDAALSQVARNTDGPVSEEFARVLTEMQIGMGRSQAMRALGERTTLPELRGFANAMVQADAFGIPVGQVLRVQSGEMRLKRRQHAEEKANKVPVKIMVPLIFCILPTLFIAVLGPAAIILLKTFQGL